MATVAADGRRGAAAAGTTPPFLTKTYAMVDDASTDDTISWNEEGTAFVVWRPAEFARDLLPKHFKHSNFSSFVRQLNTYGFRKVLPDRWEFANECFRRGEKRLLGGIQRRKVSPAAAPAGIPTAIPIISSPPSSSGGEPAVSSSPPRAAAAAAGGAALSGMVVAVLEEENARLRRENARLARELARARRLSDGVLRLVAQYNADGEEDDPYFEAGPSGSGGGGNGGRPMLFGVPIGAKRPREEDDDDHDDDDDDDDEEEEDDDRHAARREPPRERNATKSKPLDPDVLSLSMRAAAAAKGIGGRGGSRDIKNSVT